MEWKCDICGVDSDTVYFYGNKEICSECYDIKRVEEPHLCKGIEVDYTEEERTRTCPHCKGVWDTIRGLNMHLLRYGCKYRIQTRTES